MSKYFETLSRLGGRSSSRGYSERTEDIPEPGFPLRRGAPPASKPTILGDLPLVGKTRAFSGLLNSLREFAGDSAPPVVVLAGITTVEPVEAIVSGLVTQAGKEGIRILVGEILESKQARVLRTTTPSDEVSSSRLPLRPGEHMERGSLVLTGLEPTKVLNSWFQNSHGGNDLAIIRTQPVLDSADATLMARAGAGLVLAVLPSVTTRTALRKAVERAQASNARLLGIVLCQRGTHLPRWMSKLLGDSSKSKDAQTARM